MTPAYQALAEKCSERKEAINGRAHALVKMVVDQCHADADSAVLLDVVASTLVAADVHGIAAIEHAADKEEALQEHTERVLLLKVLQLCTVVMDEKHTGQWPFCCDAHLTLHVIRKLICFLDPSDAALKLNDLMCEVIMWRRKPESYFLLDKVLDKIAKRQRRKCYKMAYGKEDGERLAIEHELGLKSDKPRA